MTREEAVVILEKVVNDYVCMDEASSALYYKGVEALKVIKPDYDE